MHRHPKLRVELITNDQRQNFVSEGVDVGMRHQVDKRLLECRTEIEKQLAAIPGPKGKSGKSMKGRKVPPKYRSPSGETWAGRGVKPKWMVEALKKGKKMESFLIKKR
jgi:DNA-binding protein H-NS